MKTQKQYVPYYRVSTTRQGQSGLGLAAQKDSVNKFIKCDDCIIQEFTDIETGKNNERPELAKAIALAQKKDAILVIAKLDRLSRNLTFISALMDAKIKFIATDMPDANELTIHIFASLAQWERKRISERTKDALAQLKKRGVKLGSPQNWNDEVRVLGPLKRKEIASKNPNNVKAKKIAKLLKRDGKTLVEIAVELNESDFKTSRGGRFAPEQVIRLLY